MSLPSTARPAHGPGLPEQGAADGQGGLSRFPSLHCHPDGAKADPDPTSTRCAEVGPARFVGQDDSGLSVSNVHLSFHLAGQAMDRVMLWLKSISDASSLGGR
jgi:hypothetical protein